jgi:hypothetical protein
MDQITFRSSKLIQNVFKDLFKELGGGLKRLLLIRQYEPFLRKIKLFDDCSSGLIEKCLSFMKSTICLPETPIILGIIFI